MSVLVVGLYKLKYQMMNFLFSVTEYTVFLPNTEDAFHIHLQILQHVTNQHFSFNTLIHALELLQSFLFCFAETECAEITPGLLKSRTGEFDLESILFLKLRSLGKFHSVVVFDVVCVSCIRQFLCVSGWVFLF